MSNIIAERVISVHHWNDTLFTFKTTRDTALRFENGHFVMIGLEVDGKPLMRAYSIASANHEEYLEFLSIKVPDGPLTSRLQHLREGDSVMVSRKPVDTLVVHDLRPGNNLFLFGTGTGRLGAWPRPIARSEPGPRVGILPVTYRAFGVLHMCTGMAR